MAVIVRPLGKATASQDIQKCIAGARPGGRYFIQQPEFFPSIPDPPATNPMQASAAPVRATAATCRTLS